MIWHEFFKYGRQFRWLITALVIWWVLITWLVSTHQAFVSDLSLWRELSWTLEKQVVLIGLGFSVILMAMLWMEDSIWDATAFGHTRPVAPSENLLAKGIWLVLLCGLLPGAYGFLTSYTAQMGFVEAFVSGLRLGLFFLAVGCLVGNFGLVSRGWEDLGPIVLLFIPIMGLHAVLWARFLDSWIDDLIYFGLAVALFGFAVFHSIRAARQSFASVVLLFGYGIGLPLTMVLLHVAGSGQSSKNEETSWSASEALVELIGKDGEKLATHRDQGAYPGIELNAREFKTLIGKGLKLRISEVDRNLRCWYQPSVFANRRFERALRFGVERQPHVSASETASRRFWAAPRQLKELRIRGSLPSTGPQTVTLEFRENSRRR